MTRSRQRLHLRKSVRVRITAAAAVVTAGAVALAGWGLLRSLEDTQLSEVRSDMEAQIDRVVERLEDGMTPTEAMDFRPTPVFVLIYDEDGNLVGQPPGMAMGQDISLDGEQPPADAEGAEGTPEGRSQTGAITDANGDTMAGPIKTIEHKVTTDAGTYVVKVSAPVGQVAQVARSVDALRSGLLVGLPALVLLVAGIAWVLVGRALRPVEAIRAEVDAITGSTMHRRVSEPETDDEIGRLAHTMNEMLGRLDAAATRQRQFVSDASHELRSPVAAIRTGLEVARRKGARADWTKVTDAALAEEARLEALLDDLLLLAAADENGVSPLPPNSVNLAAVASEEAERPRSVPVHVTDSTNGESPVVQGAVEQLARVVANLLDNAARYATSAVQVRVACHDDTVRLTVDDDGPGIPEEDRERVFERFTRLDGSRTRNQGGSGLGLAVVRSIVTRHRGRVWAEAGPTGGARFVIEIETVSAPRGRKLSQFREGDGVSSSTSRKSRLSGPR